MKPSAPILLAATLVSTTALGNPILLEAVDARQLPDTMHVQVTLVSPTGAVVSATRDDVALTGVWAATAGYSMNMGSGVVSTPGHQLCDCNVAAGSHTYRIQATSEDPNLYATVTVEEDFAGRPSPQTGGAGGMMPWDEPDPIEMQGLDCTVECAGTQPGTGGAGPDGSGGGPTTDGAAACTSCRGDDTDGCAFAPRGAGQAGLAAAVLAGIAVLLRRRRR